MEKDEQFVGDTRRLKIPNEKAVTKLDWALTCFGFKAMKVSEITIIYISI